MAYTPELTYQDSCTLRRIAWALEMPMTKAMDKVFEYLQKILDREKVCEGCRDKSKCEECAFCAHNQTQQKGGGVIQSILRHKSPNTTERYLKSIGMERERDALESLPSKPAEVVSIDIDRVYERMLGE